MELNRRQFFRVCAGGLAGTTVASLGFLSSFSVHAETRQYKLLKAKETRNNCTYCSVGCGMLLYSLGDNAKNVSESIYHVEGDPDHPVSRGSLCPKGAGVVDFINSEGRLHYPEYRAPGSDKWQRISWWWLIHASTAQRLLPISTPRFAPVVMSLSFPAWSTTC